MHKVNDNIFLKRCLISQDFYLHMTMQELWRNYMKLNAKIDKIWLIADHKRPWKHW